MSEHKCPLCGKDTEEGMAFCKSCREIADNEYSIAFYKKDEETTEETDAAEPEISATVAEEADAAVAADEPEVQTAAVTPPVSRNFRRAYTLVGIGIIAIIVIAATGAYALSEKEKAVEAEAAYWIECLKENSAIAYSKYLMQYPNGQYVEQAREHILERRKMEDREWAEIKNTGDPSRINAFLIDHPDTPYAPVARLKMDSLSWEVALKEDYKEAYLTYIENVDLGNLIGEYKGVALERYTYLDELKVLEGDELKEVRAVISGFLKAASAMKKKDMESVIDPKLKSFLNERNISLNDIILASEAEMKEKKIKSADYRSNEDSIEGVLDNKNIYIINFPVRRTIKYSERKKKDEVSDHRLKAELNSEKKIIALYPDNE